MRQLIVSAMAGLLVCGCATTQNAKIDDTIKIRAAKMVEAPVFDAQAELERAQEHYARGNFKAATRAYNILLLRSPKDFESRHTVMMGYADSALAQGSNPMLLSKAAKAYSLLTNEDDLPVAMQKRLLSGQVLLEIAQGLCEDAEVRLNEALEVNIDDPRLWNALGRYHDQNQEWLVALETYVKALHVANKGAYPTAPVINNMGMSLLLQNRTKDALQKFEQAHDLNADIQIYDNNRRLALILTGRVDKAVDDLSDKKAARIYNDAGYLSAGTGRNGRARHFYKKAIELSPTYFEKAELNLLALSENSGSKI